MTNAHFKGENMKLYLFIIALGIAPIAAWITHIYWSLSGLFTGSMTETSDFVIAVLGAFIPPIGIIHGIYLWF
jgi:hypothetical protein